MLCFCVPECFATVGFNTTGLRIKAVRAVSFFFLFKYVLFIHQVVESERKEGKISILVETIPFDSGWRIAQLLQKF